MSGNYIYGDEMTLNSRNQAFMEQFDQEEREVARRKEDDKLAADHALFETKFDEIELFLRDTQFDLRVGQMTGGSVHYDVRNKSNNRYGRIIRFDDMTGFPSQVKYSDTGEIVDIVKKK